MTNLDSGSLINFTLVQFPVAFGNIEENFKQVTERLKNHVVPNNTELNITLIPELFSTGYDYNVIKSQAQIITDNDHITFLSSLSKENRSFIYSGMPEKDGQGNFYNASVLISNEGKLLQKYRKIHLFRPLGETEVFKPGSEVKILKLPFGTLGLSICYDLRFSEVYMNQRNKGVDINLICAQWPITRINHWTTLLQSRAIENQSYVCAVNNIGKDETGTYGGHSMVIAPDGEVLLNLKQEDIVKSITIDLNKIKESKKLFSILDDKQL